MPSIGKKLSKTSSDAGPKSADFHYRRPPKIRGDNQEDLDREALVEALKKIYPAESQEEAEKSLARTVGHGLSQDRRTLGNQGLCSSGFPASSEVLLPLPFTPQNQLERLAKEVKS